MNLHEIANSGSFGSGKLVRDQANAKAERRNHIPKPQDMNELTTSPHGSPIAHFGNDSEDGKDYQVTAEGYGSTVHCEAAGHDARAFVALWNAYRDGDLVWAAAVGTPTPAQIEE